MSHRKRVYSPDGQPFDVPEYRVADLVLNKGFSQVKPDPEGVRICTVAEPASAAFVSAALEDDGEQEEIDTSAGEGGDELEGDELEGEDEGEAGDET